MAIPARLLQLDDVRHIDNPENVASLFQKIGYNASAQQLAIADLELPSRSAEAIWDAYMIANHQHGSESLQVLLFQLQESEWQSPSVASNRMRSLAQSLCRRPSNFLLLGTKNYSGSHISEVQSLNRKTCGGGEIPPSVLLHPTENRYMIS